MLTFAICHWASFFLLSSATCKSNCFAKLQVLFKFEAVPLRLPFPWLPRRPADSACGQLPVAIAVWGRDFTTLATDLALHLSG
jgi:hypothetical protein